MLDPLSVAGDSLYSGSLLNECMYAKNGSLLQEAMMSPELHLATRRNLACKAGLPQARVLGQQLCLRLAQVLHQWQAHLLLMELACRSATGKMTEPRRYYACVSQSMMLQPVSVKMLSTCNSALDSLAKLLLSCRAVSM